MVRIKSTWQGSTGQKPSQIATSSRTTTIYHLEDLEGNYMSFFLKRLGPNWFYELKRKPQDTMDTRENQWASIFPK